MAREALLLKCALSLGDIVAMTAAVRDLHLTYPGRFSTFVETSCAEVWEQNPYLTQRRSRAARVITLDCDLINDCNQRPYHYLHAYHQSLSRQLGMVVEPREFKGDVHLSAQEKRWNSQVAELAGREIPFWIISAGGKFDVTIKWWSSRRYQQVVDHFRGRIQFVQVGEFGHWHPKLDGVIDLRGKTSIRQLIRLVYHSQGILCGVTGLMHLAAAIETKAGMPRVRPAVVVAGAREPAHWEAYPHHQFIQTVGAVPCSGEGGCWRARTQPLGDGDKNDSSDRLCLDQRDGLPACMDLISAEEVIDRVELFFKGGALEYLTPGELHRAKRAIAATRNSDYDDQPLTLSSVGLAFETFLQRLNLAPTPEFKGRGIIIPAGGVKYLTCAWVCISMLRNFGCRLPIELWHREGETDPTIKRLLEEKGVRFVNADEIRELHRMRQFGGWELKSFALANCNFAEALLIDADNVPVRNPESLFESREYLETGAVFWPDYGRDPKADPIWKALGVVRPPELEFESGQILVNKTHCWKALRLAMWMNGHSDLFYQHLLGDKETFHLAFTKLKTPFVLVPHAIETLRRTMCQHDFAGRRIFQHRNMDKWNLHLLNEQVAGFEMEAECRAAIRELRNKWDGGLRAVSRKLPSRSRVRQPLSISSVMLTTPSRAAILKRTIASLRTSDWPMDNFSVVCDAETGSDRRARQTLSAFKALRRASKKNAEYVLFLEDDLNFNQHLFHNLNTWGPLRESSVSLGSLYNPGVHPTAYDVENTATITHCTHVFGSQAFLLRRDILLKVLELWNEGEGMQDIRISRLAMQTCEYAHYHAPSLVQHVGVKSVWGGFFHQAGDFDKSWRRP